MLLLTITMLVHLVNVAIDTLSFAKDLISDLLYDDNAQKFGLGRYRYALFGQIFYFSSTVSKQCMLICFRSL